jgi:membrane-associated PAP2 superfamily phosphatase
MTSPFARPSPGPSPQRILVYTLLSLLLILAWDFGGLDMAMAHWFGGPDGFPRRDHWLYSTVLHEGARRLSWLLVLWLSLAVWWPLGVLRQLDRWQRLQLVVSILVGLAVVVTIKRISSTSCPWDLAEFGGLARYVSHWRFGLADGGGAHCFPAGHASAGFAFVSGYFVLYDRAPRAARLWLAAALAVGLVLGVSQQVRGAHFMSHTLWTAWLCWTVAWACHSLVITWRLRSGEKRSSHVVA